MSMPQVYLFEPVNCSAAVSLSMEVFSSQWKAISHCNREFAKPNFSTSTQCTTVSVDGTTVGWITKKFVQ